MHTLLPESVSYMQTSTLLLGINADDGMLLRAQQCVAAQELDYGFPFSYNRRLNVMRRPHVHRVLIIVHYCHNLVVLNRCSFKKIMTHPVLVPLFFFLHVFLASSNKYIILNLTDSMRHERGTHHVVVQCPHSLLLSY